MQFKCKGHRYITWDKKPNSVQCRKCGVYFYTPAERVKVYRFGA